MRLLKYLFLILFITTTAKATPINIIGFEQGSTHESNASSGTTSVQSTTKRTGTYALQTNPTTTNVGYHQFLGLASSGVSSNPNAATMYSRFYYRYATKPASGDEEIFVQRDTTNTADKLAVRINSSGNLVAYDTLGLLGTGSTVLSSGTWYRIEVKAGNGTSAAYEVKINGTTELSGTANQSATNCGGIRLGKVTNRNSQTVDYFFDDITFNDANYPGDGNILAMKPNAVGSTHQCTWGTNSSNHLEVDDIPADDSTTYIQCQVASGFTQSLFALENTGTVGISGTVSSAKGWHRVRESSGGASDSTLRLKSGAINDDTGYRNLSSSFSSIGKIYATDPNTSSTWTLSALDSVELGVTEQSDDTDDTHIMLFVDFATTTTTTTSTTTTTTVPTSTTTTTTSTTTTTTVPTSTTTTTTSTTTTTTVPTSGTKLKNKTLLNVGL